MTYDNRVMRQLLDMQAIHNRYLPVRAEGYDYGEVSVESYADQVLRGITLPPKKWLTLSDASAEAA